MIEWRPDSRIRLESLVVLLLMIAATACSSGDNEERTLNGHGNASTMVQIPAGCFDMGDGFNEGDSDELPVHNVCVSAFEMDVHEVTNLGYKGCVEAGRCSAPGDSSSYTRGTYFGNPIYDSFPVIYVSWDEAYDYCHWAGKRLPTEAEWEYAARGELAGKRYPWGDVISDSDANYWNSGDVEHNDTTAVGSYPSNDYGLADMAGNVWEWVSDWYDKNYYAISPPNDPQGPVSGTSRVLRGGSWTSDTNLLRSANRVRYYRTFRYYSVGFRCAR